MIMLSCLLPPVFIIGVGWMVLMVVDPPCKAGGGTFSSRAERVAIAPLLGVTSLTVWALLLSCLGIKLTAVRLAAVALIPVLGTILRSLHSARSPVRIVHGPAAMMHTTPGVRWSRLTWVSAVLGVLLFLGLVGSLLVEPMVAWDAVALWAYRARVIHATATLAPSITNWSAEVVAHPDYPPGLPLLQAAQYWALGMPDDDIAKVALIPFVISLAALLFAHGEGTARGLGPCVMLLGLALPVGVVRWSAGSLASGYADYPLAVIFAATSWLGLRALERNDDRAMALAAFLAGTAACVKNEGQTFAVIFVVVLALLGSAGRPRSASRFATVTLRSGLLALLVAGPWLILRSRLPPVPGDFDLHDAWRALLATDPSRAARIAYAFVRELADVTHWLLLWPAVIVSVLAVPRTRTRPFLLLGLCVTGQLVAYACIYLVSQESIDWLVATSLKRLVLHVAPVAVLFVAPSLARVLSWGERRSGV